MSDEEENNNAKAEAATEPEEADVEAMLDLSKKKKKKKKPKDDAAAAGEGAAAADAATATASTAASGSGAAVDTKNEEQLRLLRELDANQELHLPDDRKATWSYEDLLDRVSDQLGGEKGPRTRIKPPHLQLLTSKKTLWVNFQENCSMIGRDPQHVYQFFMAELGTEGNFDGNQRLIIRGKYLSKYIESLLRKYIGEYVTCEMCRSPRTELNKDPASRLYFCVCKDCGSSRSVLPIRSGYHATSRADRRAARNAKG